MGSEFLILYLILPFIFSLAVAFMNNVIHIRRLTKTLLSLLLGFSFVAYAMTQFEQVTLFNLNFDFSKNSFLIALILNFSFLIFAFLSKFILFKRQKVYYIAQFLILSFLNLFLFSDNIFILFLTLFWLNFIFYILEFNFSKRVKKVLNAKYTLNFTVLILTFCLIAYDFLRYFILNNVEFDFLNISQNLASIEPSAKMCAFFAFNILNFSILKLLPFNFETVKTVNPICTTLGSIASVVLALVLYSKTFVCFSEYYLEYQNLILIYLIFNLIYFAILLFKQSSFIKFLNLTLKLLSIVALVFLFNDSEAILPLFLYFIIVLLVLFTLLYSIYIILFSKFRKDIIEKFPSINFNLNRNFTFFFLFSFLNLAFVPGLALFNIMFYYFKDVFLNSMQFDSIISNLVPYIVLVTLFVIAVSVYDLIFRILIETKQKSYNACILSKSQGIILFVLMVTVLLAALSLKYLIYELTEGLYLSDFNTGY